MFKLLLNRVGRQAIHGVAAGHLQGSRLNIKLGFALLRDRRVSFWPKLLSLALGGGVAALLIALEISPEAALAIILPAIGFAVDFLTDGMEAIVLPLLFAALLLPFIAPRDIVDQVMAERAGTGVPSLPPTTAS
jgi:hypothetical protein